MIRVLHVVTQMGCGGMECRIMDLYRYIDRSRIQFDFYTNRMEQGDFDAEIESLGGKVFYTSPISLRSILIKIRDFSSFLSSHPEYKIVHSHVNEWSSIFCRGAQLAGVQVRIAHSRGANSSYSLKSAAKNLIRLPIKQYATELFAVSKPAAVHLFGKRAFSRGKIQIWPNAIDCQKFRFDTDIRAQMRNKLKCEKNLVLIHVGNLTPAKNHSFLIDVFNEVQKACSSALLLVVGDYNGAPHILKKASEMGLDKQVRFLGSRSDVPELLQASDVFVFPSLYEGFPGAVLEAEAAGLPCVISDAITDEVCLTEKCVQLPLSASVQTWVDTILEQSKQPRQDTFDLLSDKGYDIQAVAKQYEQFYCSSVESKT